MSNKTDKIRDFRNKGFFYIDNDYVDFIAKYLDPSSTSIYLSLCRHADKDQVSYPAQEKIAEEHNINSRTVRRKLKILEKFNIIKFSRKRGKSGQWLHNVYTLLDKTEWQAPAELTTGHQSPMVNHRTPESATTGHPCPTKETHSKETNTNTPIIPSYEKSPKKNGRPANRLANKPYSNSEWLLNLTEADVAFHQGEFPEMSVDKIREEARSAYYWQKTKGVWKKDNRSFLRNWLKNSRKFNQKKGGISFHDYR